MNALKQHLCEVIDVLPAVAAKLLRHCDKGLWQRTTGTLSSVGKHIIHLAPLVHERLKDGQWDGEKKEKKKGKSFIIQS